MSGNKRIIGPKFHSHTTGEYQWDCTFGAADFQTATGYAQLEGPLSLSLDITSPINGVIYVGIDIVTDIGTIQVADRHHIAAIPVNVSVGITKQTIGPASIPQLALLTDIIKSIIIHVYFVASLGGDNLSIALWIDSPALLSAPQQLIGSDSVAFAPGTYIASSSYGQSVAAGTTATIVTLATPASVDGGSKATAQRYRINNVYAALYPTPYPGDLEITIQLADALFSRDLAKLHSNTDQLVTYNGMAGIIIPVGGELIITAHNYNTTNAYKVDGLVNAEIIY